MTCCALHNWLLDIDGLDANWENGVRSDWEGEMGEHDACDHHFVTSIFSRVNSVEDTLGRGEA